MSTPLITPGYAWSEIDPYYARTPDAEGALLGLVDLKTQFDLAPISLSTMQDIWDARQPVDDTGLQGASTRAIVLNNRAEEGDIFWFPGWGVDNFRGGAARGLIALASLNPTKRVIAFNEAQDVPDVYKESAELGDWRPYTAIYRRAVERMCAGESTPTHFAGQSRGALIATEVAGNMPAETLTVIDAPRSRTTNTTSFALKVGVFDNRVQRKYADLVDVSEEEALNRIAILEAQNGGPREAAKKALDEWWLIRAMAKSGLQGLLMGVVEKSPSTDIFVWHGTANIGIPVKYTREVVANVASADLPKNLRYFETPTGHYSDGHTARYSRITSFAVQSSAA